MNASSEELVQAEEVGPKIAEAIADYFADEDNRRIIERLRSAGLQFEAEARERRSDMLAGKNFVISGVFENHSRDQLKEMIEVHGGKNLAAVSANVDYIIAGRNMGPAKLQKAEKLGIKLISEDEFEEMIADGNTTETPVAESAPTYEKTHNDVPKQGELF